MKLPSYKIIFERFLPYIKSLQDNIPWKPGKYQPFRCNAHMGLMNNGFYNFEKVFHKHFYGTKNLGPGTCLGNVASDENKDDILSHLF